MREPDELEIQAHVEARLLGLKLLTLDAQVVTGHRRRRALPTVSPERLPLRARDGARAVAGGGLGRAVELLDDSSRTLAELTSGA